MHKIIFIFITTLLALPVSAEWTFKNPKILGNYDGDTIKAEIELYPHLYRRTSIRVIGVDTPELNHFKCEVERVMAKKARFFTSDALKGDVEITITELDRYGRALGIVKVDGKRLDTLLIKAGLGRENHGEKRLGWCE